ncbi:YeeE/YedE family protein [Rhodobacteraceae bacterium KLH11]|nr:YeeE/YedE family protein [Rhodobacteraceae bacterium KLH11]
MRGVFAFLAGSLFGTGLLISGMTNTTKVQGWLDVFGQWDPTLAFVMGGAILPMLVAWHLTRSRTPMLGGHFPAPPGAELDHRLIAGSVLFGVGWGLAGLCPGPAMASLSFGGAGGIVFMIAMITGMFAAPKLGAQLDRMANAA